MARSDMKQKARNTTNCLHDVYNQVIAISSEFVQQNLTWKTMEPILHYHRNNNLPPIPTTIEEALEYIAFNNHPFKDYFQGYVTLGENLALFFGDRTLIELNLKLSSWELMALSKLGRNLACFHSSIMFL